MLSLGRTVGFLLLSAALFSALMAASFASPLPWNADAQGHFILATTQDAQGNLWVSNEDDKGLWRYSPATKTWTNFPPSPELPGNIYALCADRKGRVWAGTLQNGVSVFNGRAWKNYDVRTGPLGSRVFALAANPVDGDVWGATDAGLFRYSQKKDAWTYVTRADGLPSDQASCLAFDKQGNLFVGTQCNGLAMAQAADGYKRWRTVTGWNPMPLSPGGDGLPSNLINALLVSRTGAIYAATTHGLAHSYDGGKTWRFLRGADWQSQGNGLYQPATLIPTNTKGHLLLEDYVTSLGEDAAGNLYIGYRSKGYEIVARSGERLYPAPGFQPKDTFVTGFLPLKDSLLVSTYGSGLTQTDPLDEGKETAAAAPPAQTAPAPFPAPAQPPSVAELSAMLRRVQSLKGELPVGDGAYLGEDWQTEGDAIGRYGRQYARLFAIASPLDQILTWHQDYKTDAELGPHHEPGDLLRHWISFSRTDNPNALYSPVDGFRTQAEIDDHGENYAGRGFGGPDIWITVEVPEGVHRVSLYFYNKDGHTGENRKRDYLVELKKWDAKTENVEHAPALASARVRSFWGGVYQSFVVRGPSKYYVKIGKNNSFNTICSGVFIDKLLGPVTHDDLVPLPFMGGVRYEAPALTSLRPSDVSWQSVPMQAAQSLWAALDAAYGQAGGSALERPGRLLAYREILAVDAPLALAGNWRWHLHLWTAQDRQAFLPTMARADQSDRDPFWYIRGMHLQTANSAK